MGGYYGHGYRSGIRGSATLLIRHQYAHCHTWSLNGGPFKARQNLTLKRGATTLTLSKNGVYRLRTRAGEDYMSGIQTGGADNVLTLTVTVR